MSFHSVVMIVSSKRVDKIHRKITVIIKHYLSSPGSVKQNLERLILKTFARLGLDFKD